MNNNTPMSRVVIIALVLVGGGAAVYFTGNKVLWQPYKKTRDQLNRLEEETETRERELNLFTAEKQLLENRWNKFSFPQNIARAQADYGATVQMLFAENDLTVDQFNNGNPQSAGGANSQKKSRHFIVPFDVKAHGNVAALSKSLKALQKLPVMHRIKKLDVDRADEIEKDPSGRVNVTMTIEAMVIYNANNELHLDDASKYKKFETDRAYQQIALRNPFTGQAPVPVKKDPLTISEPEPFDPGVLKYVVLDQTNSGILDEDGGVGEAWLRNKILNSTIRVRPQPGFNTFKIYADEDHKKTVLRAKLLRVDYRAIHFQVGEDVYTLSFNQTLDQAMNRKLDTESIKELELTSHIDPEFAKTDDPKTQPKGPGNPGKNKNPNPRSFKAPTKK